MFQEDISLVHAIARQVAKEEIEKALKAPALVVEKVPEEKIVPETEKKPEEEKPVVEDAE
jgi:hypothetical protein